MLSREGGEIRKDIQPNRITNIVEEIGYWRKANAIHNWFVENVQWGIDECQKSYVSKEQLKTLLSEVQTVLDSPSRANGILPTGGGLFFGSTEYDEYYIEDLTRTETILKSAIKESGDEGWDTSFYYQASW